MQQKWRNRKLKENKNSQNNLLLLILFKHWLIQCLLSLEFGLHFISWLYVTLLYNIIYCAFYRIKHFDNMGYRISNIKIISIKTVEHWKHGSIAKLHFEHIIGVLCMGLLYAESWIDASTSTLKIYFTFGMCMRMCELTVLCSAF